MSAAQVAVTLSGAAAIAWVLWYFLFSLRPRVPASVEPAGTTRPPAASPHRFHE